MCPVVGLLGHMVILFLVFKGISILFSIVAMPVYILTNHARDFTFLHTLSPHTGQNGHHQNIYKKY